MKVTLFVFLVWTVPESLPEFAERYTRLLLRGCSPYQCTIFKPSSKQNCFNMRNGSLTKYTFFLYLASLKINGLMNKLLPSPGLVSDFQEAPRSLGRVRQEVAYTYEEQYSEGSR